MILPVLLLAILMDFLVLHAGSLHAKLPLSNSDEGTLRITDLIGVCVCVYNMLCTLQMWVYVEIYMYWIDIQSVIQHVPVYNTYAYIYIYHSFFMRAYIIIYIICKYDSWSVMSVIYLSIHKKRLNICQLMPAHFSVMKSIEVISYGLHMLAYI